MELGERLGVLDHHLRCERARLHVPALLELEQVAAVPQHRPLREAFQDPP